MEFVVRHELSAQSTVRQSLGVLLEKEVLHQADEGYRLIDVFLRHWLAGAKQFAAYSVPLYVQLFILVVMSKIGIFVIMFISPIA